jgi:hypothetical protein
MRALVWYTLSLLGRGQGYLAPLLLFATVLTVLTTNELGPVTNSYGACAAGQLVCMAWLTIASANAENPVQRAMTTVNAGGAGRVMLAGTLTAVLLCAALTVAGLVYPVVAGRPVVTPAAVAAGALAQLGCGAVGIAVGLFCNRQVIARAGYAVLLAVVSIGLLVVVRDLPPVGPLLALMASDRAPAGLLGPVAALTALALAVLAGSHLTAAALIRRRD